MLPVPLRVVGDIRRSLGQLGAPLVVVVVDPSGTPFSGAEVTLQGNQAPALTNGSGVATFSGVPSGDAVVQVKVGDYLLRARGPADQTLFVTVPVCSPGPVLTGTEMAALLVGGAAALGGVFYKKRAAELFGEILVGASIFSAVYRASCRW